MSEFWINTEIIEKQGKRLEFDMLQVLKSVKNTVLTSCVFSEDMQCVNDNLKSIGENIEKSEKTVSLLGNSLRLIAKLYKDADENMGLSTQAVRTTDGVLLEQSENDDKQEFYKTMEEIYGFTEDEAAEIMKAFEAFEQLPGIEDKSNREKIKLFFSCIAGLIEGYSSSSTSFDLCSNNLSTDVSVLLLNGIGADGDKLKEIVNRQHFNTDEYRDFAHECAIYSVLSSDAVGKKIVNFFDDVNDMDDLVGYKGDIYSGEINQGDIKADIAAVNAYNHMLEADNGDVLGAYMDYNSGVVNGQINESREFLEYYGKGNAKLGMYVLLRRASATTNGAKYISHKYYVQNMFNNYGTEGKPPIDAAYDFFSYLSNESGIALP